MIPEMEEVKDAALKYDKPTLARMAQMGQMSPTIAVMAGMMRDRIVQSEMKPPEPATVAEEVFMPQQAGLGAMPGMKAGVGGPPPMPPGQGIDQIPVPDQMFAPQGMAGGGIVAFQTGNRVRSDDAMIEEAIQMMLQRDPSFNAAYLRQAIADAPPEMKAKLLAQLRDRETAKFMRQGQGVPGAMPSQAGIPSPDVDRETNKFMRQGQGVPGAMPTLEPSVEQVPQTTEPPSAGLGLASIDMPSLVGRAKDLAGAIQPSATIQVPSVEQASESTSKLLKESGYDETVLDRIKEDIQKQRESMAGDKKEAMNMRLIEAGLSIMGGESPYAAVNIGKGATGAMKNLAEDLKDIKKAERDLRASEQNLMLKKNEAAMGKARVTQATIDKAQERVDKQQENKDRLVGDLTKTMLSGEIQKEVAKASYGSRMTDFDKKWSLAEDEAKRQKVPLTPQFFAQMWSVGAGAMTREEAVNKILSTDYGKQLDLSNPEDRKKLNEQVDYLLSVGSPRATSGASGKAPPPPPGFITQ